MQQNWKFRRGDIYYVQFGNTSTGSEQHGDRPAVIIQNDVGNTYAPTLIVVPLTSNTEKKVTQPTHCLLENEGLSMSSMALAEQIFTIQRKRVELIARDFNEYTANEPKISFRNGRYYVTDGQHTIEARILRNGGKDLPILCKVYTGLTMQQEALFFAEQNGHAAPLTAGIKLRAKVVGEDAESNAILSAVTGDITNRAIAGRSLTTK